VELCKSRDILWGNFEIASFQLKEPSQLKIRSAKMLKKAVVSGIAMMLCASMMADFNEDLKGAQALLSQKKNAEAKEAFIKLSETAPDAVAKANCIAFAATALVGDKKYDEAMELAKTIEDKPISINCQMDIFKADGKLKESIEAFKGEDISVWPDNIKYKGFWNRGQAYYRLNNYEAAVKDLALAAENSVSDKRVQPYAYNLLGSAYMELKDDQKALDAHMLAISNSGGTAWYNNDSTTKVAKILTKQGKYDEALKVLQLNEKIPSDLWGFQKLEAFGDLYKAQGKEKEANEKYDAALAIPKIRADWVKRVNDKRGVPLENKAP
jgi:tetratricopeptide (TPR) repeat protein